MLAKCLLPIVVYRGMYSRLLGVLTLKNQLLIISILILPVDYVFKLGNKHILFGWSITWGNTNILSELSTNKTNLTNYLYV